MVYCGETIMKSEITTEEDLQVKHKWYKQTFVQFEIVNQLKHRETVFLAPRVLKNKKPLCWRCLNIGTVDSLRWNFTQWTFWKYNYNIYHSCAILKDMPAFTFRFEEKKLQQRDFFKNYNNYVQGFDFYLDIDARTLSKGIDAMQKVANLFNDFNIPYYVAFSGGGKGFQVVIPDEYVHYQGKIYKKNLYCLEIAKRIKTVLNLKNLDLSVFDIQRIRKSCYTLDKKSGEWLVVLPLTKKQIETFELDIVKVDNVLSRIFIKQRGNVIQNLNNYKPLTIIVDELGGIDNEDVED